jgi:hypothetical protein
MTVLKDMPSAGIVGRTTHRTTMQTLLANAFFLYVFSDDRELASGKRGTRCFAQTHRLTNTSQEAPKIPHLTRGCDGVIMTTTIFLSVLHPQLSENVPSRQQLYFVRSKGAFMAFGLAMIP